jgi:hypothetical protein
VIDPVLTAPDASLVALAGDAEVDVFTVCESTDR